MASRRKRQSEWREGDCGVSTHALTVLAWRLTPCRCVWLLAYLPKNVPTDLAHRPLRLPVPRFIIDAAAPSVDRT